MVTLTTPMKTTPFKVRAVWHDPMGNTFTASLDAIPSYLSNVPPNFYAVGQYIPGTRWFDWDECREYTEPTAAFQERDNLNEEARLLESYETELDGIRKL